MNVARPELALVYAAVCLIASLAGAGFGYWIGKRGGRTRCSPPVQGTEGSTCRATLQQIRCLGDSRCCNDINPLQGARHHRQRRSPVLPGQGPASPPACQVYYSSLSACKPTIIVAIGSILNNWYVQAEVGELSQRSCGGIAVSGRAVRILIRAFVNRGSIRVHSHDQQGR